MCGTLSCFLPFFCLPLSLPVIVLLYRLFLFPRYNIFLFSFLGVRCQRRWVHGGSCRVSCFCCVRLCPPRVVMFLLYGEIRPLSLVPTRSIHVCDNGYSVPRSLCSILFTVSWQDFHSPPRLSRHVGDLFRLRCARFHWTLDGGTKIRGFDRIYTNNVDTKILLQY